jgi:hypothetical protein
MKEHANTLYVQRELINGDEFVEWARSVGFKDTLAPDKLHVTIAYSSVPVLWSKFKPDTSRVKINGGHRTLKAFGEEGKSIVLAFESNYLQGRWQHYIDGGCSYDFPKYIPHVSITYDGLPKGVKLDAIVPYDGQLRFGPETMDIIRS